MKIRGMQYTVETEKIKLPKPPNNMSGFDPSKAPGENMQYGIKKRITTNRRKKTRTIEVVR